MVESGVDLLSVARVMFMREEYYGCGTLAQVILK